MNNSDFQKAVSSLQNDPLLKTLIEKHGPLEVRPLSTNLYLDLVDSIVSQQLSIKAAETIFGRFKKLFPNEVFTPELVVEVDTELVRKAGLSYSKITYIKGLSQAVMNREIDLVSINSLSDEEVMRELTKIKGIGQWTAEMMLMFSLGRPDVFSVGDAGLRRAIFNLYGIPQTDLPAIQALSLSWRPYRTYASRYLWKSLENEDK